jgi:DNA ligase 1
MERFAKLLDRLYYTSSNLAKAALLQEYLRTTPDPDRGWTIAAIAGTLSFDLFKRNLIKQLMMQRTDPHLFELSYDYVGEMSETVAHLWTPSPDAIRLNRLPDLSEVVTHFSTASKQDVQDYLISLLDNMTAAQRWALIKLGTRGLRIGMSARFVKKILADYGNKDVSEIEALWHGLKPPYTEMLAWLDGKADKPDISGSVTFHPVMLSHPLEEQDYSSITAKDWQAEWKYDGIRVQCVNTPQGKALFSRTGDDISHSFPDIMAMMDAECVLDGELLIMRGGELGSFNELQQRLGKKLPSKKLIHDYPAGLMLYDALKLNGTSLTNHPLTSRQLALKTWLAAHPHPQMMLSEPLPFEQFEEVAILRDNAETLHQHSLIEGVMLKRKDSPYIAGRPKGYWYKWKRNPLLIDAVMMYAQRGHGKRSSFYSDFTFGCWEAEQLLPVGKAYFGFTDEELKLLDKWVRNHTSGRFGPVREVEKALVCELAFDSVHESPRHKSGLAMRFPRIHRIRWDKPATEADTLDSLRGLI